MKKARAKEGISFVAAVYVDVLEALSFMCRVRNASRLPTRGVFLVYSQTYAIYGRVMKGGGKNFCAAGRDRGPFYGTCLSPQSLRKVFICERREDSRRRIYT